MKINSEQPKPNTLGGFPVRLDTGMPPGVVAMHPDTMDALAETFAYAVMARNIAQMAQLEDGLCRPCRSAKVSG